MVTKCKTCNGPCRHDRKNNDKPDKPIIAIAGLSCETSTFTPIRTKLDAFHPLRGEDIFDKYEFLRSGSALGDAAEWNGVLTAGALPGGVVTLDAFEKLADEIISRLLELVNERPLDGLWFDIHGALSVEGLDDSEAQLLRRIRKVIGWDAAVSTSMDLHGNVSRELVQQTDLITCYRTAPHIDVLETKERACRNLVNLLTHRRECEDRGETPVWPLKAWIPIPVLLPGEKTSTRMEPAKSIYDNVPKLEAAVGVIDAAVWVGYAWADEPRSHASIIVTGWDKGAVSRGAEDLAKMFWDARKDFRFVAPSASFDKCLDTALESTARPYFISDSGDNPTAGGAGNVTWTLHQIISRSRFPKSTGTNIIYASLPAPAAVATAVEAGLGATVTVRVGTGEGGKDYNPITMAGCVYAIKHGDADAETEVVLESHVPTGFPKLFTILTQKRKPYHHAHDFTDLNLNITPDGEHSNAIVILKIGYLEPELYDLAKDWMLALTPGGVDQDLVRLGHEKIERPMWPFGEQFDEKPDLIARLVGRGCEG